MSRIARILPATLLAAAVASASLAEERAVLALGDRLPRLELKDQHERPAPIPDSTRGLLLAVDNASAGLVDVWLGQREPRWLAENGYVYLADIHRMPSLIARLIALPALRDKPYPIVLGREAADLAAFPRQPGCVTLIALADRSLSAIRHVCNAADLAASLNQK